MKYYLALLLFLFMGCAAQMAPKGGPIDNEGPKLLEVSHSFNSKIFNTNEQIIFYFNEFINPLSIVNSIEIINFTDFNYKVRGKKIIISPNIKWPNYKMIKMNISRNISDFNGNTMDDPIQVSFSNGSIISNNKIFGELINTNDAIFDIGLYSFIDSSYTLIDKIESNKQGNFKFQYLDNGQYIIAAVSNKIDVLQDDIRNKRYGFISQNFIDLFNQDSTNIIIKIDNPLERLEIKSFRQINNNFGYIMLDNGSEKPFLISQNQNFENYLDINIKLNNRIESYIPKKYITELSDIIDTIPPKILSSNYVGSELKIVFDEPISRGANAPNIYYKLDTTFNKADYSFIDSFSLKIDQQINSNLYIDNVYDTYLNKILDTLYITNQLIIDEIIPGGNIYGTVEYSGDYPIIVKAESLDSEFTYYDYIDSKKEFSFLNINSGFYNFTAYEILGSYDSTQYYNGSWAPFKRAAKFGIYSDVLEVRTHWDIKNMVISIK